jgi:hypothetical protein
MRSHCEGVKRPKQSRCCPKSFGPLDSSQPSQARAKMDTNERRQLEAREHVTFTNRISLWLKAAGVDDSDVRATLAVGLADLTHAASVATKHLEGMLNEQLADSESADRALEHAVGISTYLFTELKDHLLEIEEVWETEIEERLAERGSPDPQEDV